MRCVSTVTIAVVRSASVLVALLATACSSGSGMPSSSSDTDGGMTGGIDFPSTGNQYVDARRCPACHQGADPQQTGFMSGALQPIPGDFGTGVVLYGPNLTPDPTTGLGSWTDDQIKTAILYGIDNQGERLCPQMQHFADMQSDELDSVLAYLHSLKPVQHQATLSKCPPLKY